jgi:Trk K+ transport system NAD-binding subunit
METVTTAITDTGVPRLILATADAHEVYRDVGFTELAHPERWMERDRRPAVSGPGVS